jgi:serine/threonine protein kinase
VTQQQADGPKDYAMKAIRMNNLWDDKTQLAKHQVNEIEIMLNLHNPYAIQIHEVIEEPSEKTLYLVTKYYPNGTLQDVYDNAILKVNEQLKVDPRLSRDELWTEQIPLETLR